MYIYDAKLLVRQEGYKTFIQPKFTAWGCRKNWTLLTVISAWLPEFVCHNQLLYEDRWMTSHSSDHRCTAIHLEKNLIVDLKWNTEGLFWCVSWWKGLNTSVQKGTLELIIWITESGRYSCGGKKTGGRCSLSSLLDEMKLPGYSSEEKTQHVYEWTCLPMTSPAPGFLALKNQWVGFSYQEREKVLSEDSNKLDTAFNKGRSDPVFFWSSPI